MGKKRASGQAQRKQRDKTALAARDGEPRPESRDILTVEQAADYLQVSRATVFKLVREQGLPAAKIGGSVRFARAQLLEWLIAQSRMNR